MRALLHDALRAGARLAEVLLLADALARPARGDAREERRQFVCRRLRGTRVSSLLVALRQEGRQGGRGRTLIQLWW